MKQWYSLLVPRATDSALARFLFSAAIYVKTEIQFSKSQFWAMARLKRLVAGLIALVLLQFQASPWDV
jgi:hypothetical protein